MISRTRIAALMLLGLSLVAWFGLSPVTALLYLATALATAVIVLGLNKPTMPASTWAPRSSDPGRYRSALPRA